MPPWRDIDKLAGIQLEVGFAVNNSFPFGANVTYICPFGTVFNGTNSRYLEARCYGSVGWFRPINLTCVAPSKFRYYYQQTRMPIYRGVWLLIVSPTKSSLFSQALIAIGSQDIRLEALDPRTQSFMSTFDGEEYCAEVNGTMPLIKSANDTGALGQLLASVNASHILVANNIRFALYI